MAKQIELNIYQGKRGCRRSNSGRKRIHSRGVSHGRREAVTKRTPVHINFKYHCHVKTKEGLRVLKLAIKNAHRQGLRIIHFPLQSNHAHLVAEADNNKILTKGMRSLTITFSKGLGKGRIQIERYHLHVLRTLREARNAIHYVLFNQQKHSKSKVSAIDGYSSLLYLPNALDLIRNFTREKRVTLLVRHKDDAPELSQPKSFFLIKSGQLDSP